MIFFFFVPERHASSIQYWQGSPVAPEAALDRRRDQAQAEVLIEAVGRDLVAPVLPCAAPALGILPEGPVASPPCSSVRTQGEVTASAAAQLLRPTTSAVRGTSPIRSRSAIFLGGELAAGEGRRGGASIRASGAGAGLQRPPCCDARRSGRASNLEHLVLALLLDHLLDLPEQELAAGDDRPGSPCP